MRRGVSPRKVLDLWLLYAAFRQGQLAPSTFKRDYHKITRRLERMQKEAPHLETAIEIRDWLLREYAAETARRTLVQLQACGRWAMESSIISANPFQGVPRHVRPAHSGDRNWAAFTSGERDRIIQEFDLHYPHYGPWVKFLFWTGCRPEEASALRWKHIAGDGSEILFEEARPVDTGEVQGTKNYKTTRFPCNPRLQLLLQQQQEATGGGWVLPGVQGEHFDYHNFQSRYWKPMVTALAEQGEIAFYLPQYHCRHTAITLMLEAGMSPQDVSYLCRVSVATLYAHYVGRGRTIIIPEF